MIQISCLHFAKSEDGSQVCFIGSYDDTIEIILVYRSIDNQYSFQSLDQLNLQTIIPEDFSAIPNTMTLFFRNLQINFFCGTRGGHLIHSQVSRNLEGKLEFGRCTIYKLSDYPIDLSDHQEFLIATCDNQAWEIRYDRKVELSKIFCKSIQAIGGFPGVTPSLVFSGFDKLIIAELKPREYLCRKLLVKTVF